MLFLKRLYPLVLIGFILYVGISKHAFFLKNDDPYSVFIPEVKKTNIHFEEMHTQLGIDHFNNSLQPLSVVFPLKINSGVAIADLNNDGFPDLIYNLNFDTDYVAVYINDGKGHFKRLHLPIFSRKSIDMKPFEYPNSIAVFDYDNNGTQDLFISGFKRVILLKNLGHLNFSNETTTAGLDNLHGPFINVNVFDFNQDGWLDVLVLPLSIFDKDSDITHPLLLLNNGKTFVDATRKVFNTTFEDYTWSSLLGYLNNVHQKDYFAKGIFKPDIYIQNDYTRSKYYTWGFKKNAYVERGRYLPRSTSHGQMGGDVADLFNNHKNYFFSSNMPISKFTNGFNYLLSTAEENPRLSILINEAPRYRLDSCGLAWGARFFDANNDGLLDLFVANGAYSYGKKPIWYKFNTWLSIPYFLRKGKESNPNYSNSNLATNQRNCMFVQNADHTFSDSATAANILDLYDGRGVAIGDLNSDGKLDLIIANFNGPPLIYMNESPTNNWIGIKLIRKNHVSNIGAIYNLKTNKFTNRKEFFPNNGIAAQNENFVHFGLGAAEPMSLEILLPGHKKPLVIKKLIKNKYNTIYEDKL